MSGVVNRTLGEACDQRRRRRRDRHLARAARGSRTSVLSLDVPLQVVVPAVRFVADRTDHFRSVVHDHVPIEIFGEVEGLATMLAGVRTLVGGYVLSLVMIAVGSRVPELV